jgi:predicted GNAT family N-acyltransferase
MFTVVAFGPDDPSMAEAHRIRELVFCREQAVSPDEEWDGKDHLCRHFLIRDGKAAIGTARIRPYGPGIFKIERVAVLKDHRGRNAGKALMTEIMTSLQAANPAAVVLNAQCAVEGFYRNLGFTAEGEVFEEANIPHIHMVWRP